MYYQQQAKKGRRIITPEHGMFIGPDQAERTKLERERKLENKRDLEKVSVFGIVLTVLSLWNY